MLDQNPAVSNRDLSSSYNTISQLYSDGYKPYRESRTRKRQSDNNWRHDSYHKRSAGARQLSSSSAGPLPTRNQRPIASRIQQKNSTPFKNKQASKQSIDQKINNQKRPKPSKEIVTNKATKVIKAYVPPKKLESQPENKLVTAASTSAIKIKKNDLEDLRLHPDKEPTNQVIGRLELALGTLLREIRETFGLSLHYQVLQLQRVTKITIRERLRNVMLGKIVGSTAEIIKEYRAVYPKDTDEELANMALEAENMKVENESKLLGSYYLY